MDSILRDIERESQKMQKDVDNLHRHYEKLQGYVSQHVQQSTIEWAKVITDHSKALLLIVETTRITDEHGYSYGGEIEPIRFTTLSLTTGEVWDQLLHPTHSKAIQGTEYHGLQWSDLEGKPCFADIKPKFAELFENQHIIVFGADWACNALHSVYPTFTLDNVFCLHNKCKEYYGEFYELSLEKILTYQGIEKKREELTNSGDRIRMLEKVIHNLAQGMKKVQPEEAEEAFSLELDDHPF